MVNVIVGAGISGATIANKIANELKEKVIIIDERSHVGGNCYDYKDPNGILIHKYGAHIFHTNNEEVWEFISKYTKWYPYIHKVKGFVDGQYVPIPFNLNSLYKLFSKEQAKKLENKLISTFGYNIKVSILDLKKSKNKDLNYLAEYIYDKIFLNYTLKQWGLSPENISSAVSRVPVYISKDNCYFQDRFQGIPLHGYTKTIENILDNSLIEINLETKWNDVKNIIKYDRLFYTGAIDEFFDYRYGSLPYRSLSFDFINYNNKFFQKCACINYPNNYSFTRIIEHKHFLNIDSNNTVVTYEYPCNYEKGKNERFYPINIEENNKVYDLYLNDAKHLKNTYFLGRLGDYKYYDMDKAIKRALDLFKEI